MQKMNENRELVEVNKAGEMPQSLVDKTLDIIQIHRANGDLSWLQEMADTADDWDGPLAG